jgi:hypothetical protein
VLYFRAAIRAVPTGLHQLQGGCPGADVPGYDTTSLRDSPKL